MKNHKISEKNGIVLSFLLLSSPLVCITKPSAAELNLKFQGDKLISAHINSDIFLSMGVITRKASVAGKLPVVINLLDRDNRAEVWVCNNEVAKAPVAGYYLPKDRTQEPWPTYARFASEQLELCSGWSLTDNKRSSDIIKAEVFVFDGYKMLTGGNHSGIILRNVSVNEQGTECSTSIVNQMAFGLITVSPSTLPSATGRLSVECNKKSEVTISVNGSNELINSDGSKIQFQYEPTSSVEANIPRTIDIHGELLNPPTRLGSYQWSVPIKVSYE